MFKKFLPLAALLVIAACAQPEATTVASKCQCCEKSEYKECCCKHGTCDKCKGKKGKKGKQCPPKEGHAH